MKAPSLRLQDPQAAVGVSPGVVAAAEIEGAWELVRHGEQLAGAELRLKGSRLPYQAQPAPLLLRWGQWLGTDLTRVNDNPALVGRVGTALPRRADRHLCSTR